jgi:HAD superfamily hydrolase (TIGR01450 family)
VFVTNNASRDAHDVVTSLAALPVAADPAEIVTSAMVATEVLASRLPAGAAVLVVGGSGLVAAVEAAGLRAVRSASADVAAVVQGWAPEVDWTQLAEASVALRAGAPWIATNDDRTLPSTRGPLPGNGSMVAALMTATGLRPEVIGKPHQPLFTAAAARTGATAPLFVGDRLDTDVAGARRAGIASLLVLTGVAQPADLLGADPDSRPNYVGLDLRALLHPQPPVAADARAARCGNAVVTASAEVVGGGVDALRAACALAWSGHLPPDRYDAVLSQIDELRADVRGGISR